MQQQQPHTEGKPQGGLTWVYNDLPVTKLKVLGIIQIIIGSIYIIFNAISSFSSSQNEHGFSLGITILGSGGAAMWTLQRKDKMLVTGTALLALIAAIFTGIAIGLTVLIFLIHFLGLALASNTNSHSSSGSGSGYGSSYHYEDHSQAAVGVVMLVIFILSLLFQVLELIVSIVLALTTKRILDNSQPVPPAGATVTAVTFEKV